MAPYLVLDAMIALALVLPPGVFVYLGWVLIAVYGLISIDLLRMLWRHQWVWRITGDRDTRVAHGLEHATIAVLERQGAAVRHGFTPGPDRFVVALEAGSDDIIEIVREAAIKGMRRARWGQRLIYTEGCGTNELVSSVMVWLGVVSSSVIALAIGAPLSVAFALGLIALRIWAAITTPLGLAVQQWLTVTPVFASGSVVDVRRVSASAGRRPPSDETWVEVIVDIRPLVLRDQVKG
jgi:hypothetical protein